MSLLPPSPSAAASVLGVRGFPNLLQPGYAGARLNLGEHQLWAPPPPPLPGWWGIPRGIMQGEEHCCCPQAQPHTGQLEWERSSPHPQDSGGGRQKRKQGGKGTGHASEHRGEGKGGILTFFRNLKVLAAVPARW